MATAYVYPQSLTSRLTAAALVRRKRRGSSGALLLRIAWPVATRKQHSFRPMRRSYSICLTENSFIKPQTQHRHICIMISLQEASRSQVLVFRRLSIEQRAFIQALPISNGGMVIQHDAQKRERAFKNLHSPGKTHVKLWNFKRDAS